MESGSWIDTAVGRGEWAWMMAREESARAIGPVYEIRDELRSLDEEQLKKVILGEPS